MGVIILILLLISSWNYTAFLMLLYQSSLLYMPEKGLSCISLSGSAIEIRPNLWPTLMALLQKGVRKSSSLIS
jgi:hypothetical protein